MELLESARFTYQAKVDRVIDGDSIVCTFDLGFNMRKAGTKVRLLEVDTHEIHFVSHASEEYKMGIDERKFVVDWIDDTRESADAEWPFIIDTVKNNNTGKYGRYLGYVYRVDTQSCLNQDILDEFDGVEYDS